MIKSLKDLLDKFSRFTNSLVYDGGICKRLKGIKMKHLKPITPKAKLFEDAIKEGTTDEVIAMSSIVGCVTTFDPGWEVDSDGGLASLCQPLEADLYGCSDPCWWPTQVPDTSSSYKNWADKAPSSKDDWRELENVYPKI